MVIKNFKQFNENKINKKAILISAFPGVGKSHLFKNNKKWKILDSDSSTFDKKDFPENYIKHIKNNINKVDIICISSHKDVRDALVDNNLNFYLVYPKKEIKSEYIERYKNRGNKDGFIKLLNKNWEDWIEEMENQKGCTKIELSEGEYLSDKIDLRNLKIK